MKDERKVRKDEVAGHARIESDQLEGFNEEMLADGQLEDMAGGGFNLNLASSCSCYES